MTDMTISKPDNSLEFDPSIFDNFVLDAPECLSRNEMYEYICRLEREFELIQIYLCSRGLWSMVESYVEPILKKPIHMHWEILLRHREDPDYRA